MTDKTLTDLDKARMEEIERRKKRARLEKKLFEVERRIGVGSLFGPASAITDATKAKEKKVVLEALAFGIDVHRKVLAVHGLLPEPNPQVPARFAGEEPF